MGGSLLKTRVSYIVSWLLLTALIVATIGRVDWTLAIAAVAKAKPLPLILAVLLNAMILVFATAQWLLFLPEGVSVARSKMFKIMAIMSTVANSGPAGGGAAVGVHLLARQEGVGHSVGLSVLLLDQLVEGLVKVAIVLLAIVVVPIGLEYKAVSATILIGVPTLFFVLTVIAHRRFVLESISERTTGFLGWILTKLNLVAANLEALRRPKKLSLTVVLGLLQKLVAALAITCVLIAFGVVTPWWGILAVLVAVNLSTVVSVTPANLGVFEGAAFLVYTSLGISSDTAVALAIVQHAAYLIPLAGIGWVISSVRPLNISRSKSEP
ncbi:MAG: lysylphosphatidylglycerol synthase transmembrane domain-containing protein [Gemmatimonadota bacterium]|nr:lysylphosphatidylglycerol synthase transmembrane domain-containing protein [Gemmatimonadota bacterium]